MMRVLIIFSTILVTLHAHCDFIVNVPTTDVWRPCPFDDLECMQKVFIEKKWCYDEKDYPYEDGYLYESNVVIAIPYFNVTTIQDVTYGDLSKGRVVEFYFNKKSGDSVFALQFDDFEVSTDVTMLLHRKLQEDIKIRTNTHELYDSIITTTIIKKGEDPKTKSTTKAYISNIPKFSFGKGAEKVKNKEVKGLLDAFYSRPDVVVAELNQVRATTYSGSYAENIICGYKPPKNC